MKKVIFALFLFSLLSGMCFAQDDLYGDYLLSSIKKTVSLDLEGASLIDVLKMLSQQTGLNFVATDAVRDRQLVLYIEKVPLKEALDIIFKVNNLTYDYYPEVNVFVVKEMGKPTIELKTKVYKLRYIRVKSSRLEQEIKDMFESEDEGGEGGGEEGEDETVKTAIENLLTEFGKVSEDPVTNSLIVVDVPSQFPLIDEVLAQLDKPPAQVMIEVEMLDVSKRQIDKMGVNWPEALVTLGVSGTRFTKFPFGGKTFDSDTGTYSMEKGTTLQNWEFNDIPMSKFSPTVLTVVGTELVLNFLRSLSDTKSIARPKIMTVENQTAQINITTDEAIGVTKTEETQGSGSTTFTIERAETGTSLRVTPQVDYRTGEITLLVNTAVNEAKSSGFSVSSSNQFIEGSIKDPERRAATTMARLQSGETLLLGGLIKTTVNNSSTKVPILGDTPFIGRFFRWKNEDVQERELLVFLTPKLINHRSLASSNRFMSPMSREQNDPMKNASMTRALDRFSR